jgi:hypothetical protein
VEHGFIGKKEKTAMSVEGFAHARALSRQFFPQWSRHARARWVLARLQAQSAKVAVSSAWSHDVRAYWYQRVARA